MKFSNFISNKIFESISYDYSVPKNDFLKQVYDFYFWTLFYSTVKNSNVEKSVQLKPGWDEDTYLDLKNIVISATEELVDLMHEKLIEFLALAISSEIRHALVEGVDNDPDDDGSYGKGGLDHAKENGVEREYRKFFDKYLKIAGYEIGLKEAFIANGASSNYDDAYKAFKQSGMTYQELAKLGIGIFDTNVFPYGYGGKNWVNLSKALMKLSNAKTYEEKIIWIDHAFDLEHNNNTFLDKIEDFHDDKFLEDFKLALDVKRDASMEIVHKNTSVPKHIFYYLKRYLTKETLEVDSKINFDVKNKSAKQLYNYAFKILKGRFEEAEDIIAKSGYYSYMYALNVLKGRFEKGEKEIAKTLNWSDYVSFLKKKGVRVKSPSYEFKENMIFKSFDQLILEGKKEKAAEEFIKNTIKGTKWEGKVFVAGGYVRDEFMGKDPKDLDLLVNAPNGGIEFANWITKKIGAYKKDVNPVVYPRFGTAKFTLRKTMHNGIDISDLDIEAVMPRKEKYEQGSRKPEVESGTLKDDVDRRDFTVNSLLKDLSSGEVLDLTGMGKMDIKKGVVRTPLDPDIIFSDDPLRMLRAVRFTIKYNWDLPMFMIRSIKKNAHKINDISSERIQEELNKMLLTSSPERAIKLLKSIGLLKYIMPEFNDAVGMKQNIHHDKDVFGHTLDVLSKTKPELKQRLMALFHDIGKTVTRSVTPSGVHFYDHEDKGAEITQKIMRRLKYPNEIIDAVVKGVKNHMRLKSGGDDSIILSDKALRKFANEMGEELENVLDVIHADNISHSDVSSMPNQIQNIRKRFENLKTISDNKPKLPINGNDVMTKFNLKPSRKIGEILSAITDAWYENPEITEEEAYKIAEKIIGE